MTMVVPTLGGIADAFSADFAIVQFLVSAYLFGLATGQPYTGVLCDRLGRRPVMLGGFAAFVITSIACAFATELWALIGLRFLQAVGVSVGTVASRAIVRDTHGPEAASRALTFITAAMGAAPVIGPMLGGWIGQAAGFRGVFIASAAMGLAVWFWMFLRLPETYDPDTGAGRGASRMWRDYGALFRSRVFMGYALIYGFISGTFFSFIAIGAEVFDRHFGIDQSAFGILWGFMAISHVAGASAGGYAIERYGSQRVLYGGILMSVAAGWLILGWTFFWGVTLSGVLLPLLMLNFTSGIVTPGSLAAAVSYRPDIAGTASGLSSAIGIVTGGLFTMASGYVYDGEFLPVAGLIAAAATLTYGAWIMTRSPEPMEPTTHA